MKKILILLGLTLVLLTACSEKTNYIEVETTEVNMSGYENMPVTGHNFLQTTPQEILRLIEDGGSAVVYYGYDSCPFCNKATSVINDAAKELDITVLYVNVHPDEDPGDEYYDAMDETTLALADFLSVDEEGCKIIKPKEEE